MKKPERKNLILKTNSFLQKERNWFQLMLKSSGWNLDDMQQLSTDPVPFKVCPCNCNHRMPSNVLAKHVVVCEKKHDNFSAHSTISDSHIKTSIADGNITSDTTAYSSDSIHHGKSDENLTKVSSTSTTLAELLQAERDAKRRRISHRGKRGVSKKNNYKEVLRDLIENEMKAFEGCPEDETETVPGTSSKRTDQKTNAEENSYLGVGDVHYYGNPFKRWTHINKEEAEFMKDNEKRATCRSGEKISRNFTPDRNYDRTVSEKHRRHSHSSDEKTSRTKRRSNADVKSRRSDTSSKEPKKKR